LTKIVRTHDSLYLEENRYQDPKQLYLEIVEKIKQVEKVTGKRIDSILDAGCAAGEFAFLLKQNFPHSQISGFDLLSDLVEKAELQVNGCEFFEADIQKKNVSLINLFDVVVCTGVLSIFDTFEEVINNLISWVKPGGTVFIHSLFNDYPINVWVQYNLSEDYTSGIRECGWNIFSKKSVSDFLDQSIKTKLVKSYSFSNFEITRELEKREDVVRSWTEKSISGNLQITNGLMLLQPHAILEIKRTSA
jgi:2-polyprenyl-3-methyl-5-hydroxy-6-metoxy-1,4-benzoquinol methylase